MLAGERLGGFPKPLDALGNERSDRALEDELNQDLVGIERAGTLPGGFVCDDLDLAFLLDHLVFQQALVDRAELLDREVAVVDATPAVARERIEQRREGGIQQLYPIEKRGGLGIEQTAVVRRQAERGLAPVDRAAKACRW
jgi:hypothetical protein